MKFFVRCFGRPSNVGLDQGSGKKMDHSHGSLLSIFRFASLTDKFLIFLGTIAAIGTGTCVPLLTINLASITHGLMNGGLSQEEIDEFICSNATYNDTGHGNSTENKPSGNGDVDKMVEEVARITMYVLMFAAIKFLCTFLYVACFNTAAENQVHRMRNAFFKAMLHHEIAWHDENKSTTYTARFAEDMKDIQDGIGEKIGMMITAVTGYVSGIICAFLHGWKFTLVILGVAPITSITIWILARLQARFSSTELNAKAETGGIAQEVFGAIRTVLAFDGQEKEMERFRLHSETARKVAIKRGIVTACISAVGQGFQFFVFALGFWYGAELVADICQHTSYSSLDILIVFFCVLGGTTKMSTITPYLENFTRARSSAAFVSSVLDRQSAIDSSSDAGLYLETLRGRIFFENVHFKYPTRPDVPVLKGVTFEVQPRQTVALVGPSGSGKSTCVQLIMRFYDPESGCISIDGLTLQHLNLNWLRSQIGIVSQEPVLFSGSIGDNIRYGRPDVTQEEIEIAARQANAEEFILKLKDKYDTVVGERGARLSGGQKQRIAIARALVRNPSILLLDEATSALDNHSELLVQQALERASQGRTVLIVAHRLSTIRKADVIIVFKDGAVIETGDHKTLIAQRGEYFKMVSSQGKRSRHPSKQQSPYLNSMKSRHGSSKTLSKRKRHLSHSKPSQPASCDNQPRVDTLKEKKKFQRSVRKQIEREKVSRLPQASWFGLLKLGKKESIYLAAGVLASAFVGFSGMTLSYLFGLVLKIFVPSASHSATKSSDEDASTYSCYFILAGTLFAVLAFLQSWFFTVAGESLIERLRTCAFCTIVKKDVVWFDREENKVGALCSRISTDTARVQGGTGLRMGLVCQAIATILVCDFMTFYYHWKFGLLALGITPIMGAIIYFQSKVTTAIANVENERSSEAFSSEVIANIRTVVSLGREDYFYSAYAHSQQESHRVILGNIWKRGVIYALASSFPQFSYALSLFLGSTLTADGLTFDKIITIGHGLRYGMMAISDALEFSPNFFEAKLAAHRVLLLINEDQREKARTSWPELVAYKQSALDCDRLDFEDVTFRYPVHSNNQALQKLSFSVRAGKTVALVGGSGSGKSTCIQLILRFYDPDSGSIRVNSTIDARQLSIRSLRSNLGFVSQEPVLFDKTIRENIAYGDNGREIQMDEIIEAARMANIHSFIESLPHGYDTVVGCRGAQLSGGEKQRIAIARALVRKPKILLLDEATSALDNESEKVVQLALDAARKGRTCITVAHRLSTVRNADCIVVMHKGRVHEQGTHDELMQLGGMYAKLVSADFQGN